MTSDEDIALSEKRVYGDRRSATRAYVVGDLGIATVDISDDQVGRFGLEYECTARDVDGRADRLAVATSEDVLVGTEAGFVEAGFGPATAVGVVEGEDESAILAADAEGRVARRSDDEWTDLGEIAGVRAIDGDLLAAADGVYTVDEDGLDRAGLDDARDVAGAARLAATGTGVYERVDGWNRIVEGDATVIASDGDRAHCVVEGTLRERVTGEAASDVAASDESDPEPGTDAWADADAPVSDVVDVAYGRATVVVTADGTVALDPVAAKDGAPEWRSRSLGLRSVAGVAIP